MLYNLPVPHPADSRDQAFTGLFDRIQVGAFAGILSDAGERTLAANAQLRLIFGYPLETAERDVAPFAAARFIDPQARPSLLERLRHDGSIADFLVRMRRVDLTPIWIEITGHAEALPDGSLRFDALVRDVSDRKKLDDQTRDLYHQLLQAEKLASLGQTISGVAHELNNPLATILTWAERLSHRQADDQTRRGLDVILSRSRALGAHRPQPAHVRAQAAHDARDGGHQPGRARDAGAARVRAARHQHHRHQGARGRPAARCSPTRTSCSRCCSIS